MSIDNISKEFAYEFFSQLKRFSEEKEENFKLKPKEKKIDYKEEINLIRPLVKKKKIDMKNAAVINLKMNKTREIARESAFEKIERLMDDSTIDFIECNGPEEEITIKSSGEIKKAEFKLRDYEIKEIFRIIEKENNERLNKLFKANFRDFIISGINSEFIGSSFMLSRKNTNIY